APDLPLRGQRALVTGASSGIGLGIATAFAAAGADLLVHYHSSQNVAEALVADINVSGARALAVPGDLAKPEEVSALFEEMDEGLGGIDILVANAGIQRDAGFAEMSRQDWQAVIDVNLTGQFLCA